MSAADVIPDDMFLRAWCRRRARELAWLPQLRWRLRLRLLDDTDAVPDFLDQWRQAHPATLRQLAHLTHLLTKVAQPWPDVHRRLRHLQLPRDFNQLSAGECGLLIGMLTRDGFVKGTEDGKPADPGDVDAETGPNR